MQTKIRSTRTPQVTNPTTQASGGASATDDFPERRHAGKVGYGPNYHAGPGLEDRIEGLKEEIKGKITRNPDRVQHGREIFTGEEKRKKLTGEDEPNPFANAGEDDSTTSEKSMDSNKCEDSSKTTKAGGESLQLPSGTKSDSTPPESSNAPLSQGHGTTDEALASQYRANANATPGGMAVGGGHGPGAKEQAATVAPEGTHESKVQEGDAADKIKHIDARN